MASYPVEAYLRPKYEYTSAIVCGAGAFSALVASESLMLTPATSYAVAGLLGARGLQRLLQGWRVHRYQRGLRRTPAFVLESRDIPSSTHRLFVGRGFEWRQVHCQRLADVERWPELAQPSALERRVRAFEARHEHTPVLARLAALSARDARWNPLRPRPAVGGNAALHAVGLLEGEDNVYLDQIDRNGHTLVLGTTGVGKTRFLDIMVRQDIRNEDVVIVFDPKGDGELLRSMVAEARRCGRSDQFYCFHLGFPDISARYNPVGNFSRVTEISSRIAGQLPGEGQSQAFKEFVWRYVNVIAKTLTALGRRASYEQIKFHGENIEPLFIAYLEHHLERAAPDGHWRRDVGRYEKEYGKTRDRDPEFNRPRNVADRSARSLALLKYYRDRRVETDIIAHSLIKTFEYERGYLDKLVGSLLPLMEKLCTGKTTELLSPNYTDIDDPRPIFDWMEIIRTRGIVYVGLDALSDAEVAAAVGNSMFADLTAVAGQIYKSGTGTGLPTESRSPRVNIHADEFNELIGDEFIPLVNKGRGAGFQVTAYTQTWSDVEARLNSRAKAGQVEGNFNNLFMLRVKSRETAKMLTDQLKETEINQLTTISATNDSSDPHDDQHFTSRTEQRISSQRVDLVHPHDLTTLPKGQAFALLDGGRPFKLRIPLPGHQDLAGVPREIESIAEDMIRRYRSSETWAAHDDSFALSSPASAP